MKISPSILDADFKNLQSEIDSLSRADRIHLDIMDGHYVPNLSFGPPVFKNLKFPVEIETHLMVNDPENFFEMFKNLGSKTITFHIENTGNAKALELLRYLKKHDLNGGICIDGNTNPEVLSPEILETADQLLVMSVKAGLGGQDFMPVAVDKVKKLRVFGFKSEIEVDGGINLENASELSVAGANIVVVGSFLMKKPSAERKKIIEDFQKI